jgi:hypothetical protein
MNERSSSGDLLKQMENPQDMCSGILGRNPVPRLHELKRHKHRSMGSVSLSISQNSFRTRNLIAG